MHRVHDLRKMCIYIINTVLDNNQLTTNFNTIYIPLQVIFMHVDKASILTIIFRGVGFLYYKNTAITA